MTYSMFLLVALVPPIALLTMVVGRMRDDLNASGAIRAIAYLVIIAVAYTTPWDNYLIYRQVWWYGVDRVMGVIGYVPIEEYGFMALQAIMTGLLTVVVFGRRFEARTLGPRAFTVGLLVWAAVAVAGLLILLSGSESWLYLGLITVWAGPVLAGTWWLGGRRFLAGGWRYAIACGVPSVYLWIWDAFAIGDGIWAISEVFTLGLTVGPLPLEEATFFLVTNVLVVQGVLLFWDPRRP